MILSRNVIGLNRCRPVACSLLALYLPLAGADFQPPLKTPDGFAVPQPGHRFEFPRDHGSHPEFKIEWWYVTGHLFGEDGHRFGFQATFFRRAGPLTTNGASQTAGDKESDEGDRQSGPQSPEGSGTFGNAELHLAHMALLDVPGDKFIYEERLNRQGWDADSSTNTLAVRNGNWSLCLGTNADGQMSLQGSIRGEAAYSLRLTPTKPLVIFGENAVSRKGGSQTASSYYLTFSRLQAAGDVTLNGRTLSVQGQAWMDHEISSSQLDQDQVGWDWACLQLRDGREIMVYRMRQQDGSTDPASQLAWVDALGAVTNFSSAQFGWSASATWKSRVTGGTYPIRAKLTTTDPASGKEATFSLEPLSPAQELGGALGGIPYWEGACRVLDAKGDEVGSAYLELTGYAGIIADRFR